VNGNFGEPLRSIQTCREWPVRAVSDGDRKGGVRAFVANANPIELALVADVRLAVLPAVMQRCGSPVKALLDIDGKSPFARLVVKRVAPF
jgi:hypothetical protein